MTKQTVKQIRIDLQVALAAVGKKHGMAFDIGTIRFDATSMRGKLSGTSIVNVPNAVSVPVMDIGKANFLKYVGIHGLAATDLGRQIEMGGKRFTIVGYSPRKPKFPFELVNIRGRKFKASKMQILQGFANISNTASKY